MKTIRKVIRKMILENQQFYTKLMTMICSGDMENINQALSLAEGMGYVTDIEHTEEMFDPRRNVPQHIWLFYVPDEGFAAELQKGCDDPDLTRGRHPRLEITFPTPPTECQIILRQTPPSNGPGRRTGRPTRRTRMKRLGEATRRVLLEQDEYIEKLNTMYASPNIEIHNQADQLVDALYGDNPPSTLRRYGAYDSYMGDTLEDCLTKEEARTWWHRNKDWFPANTDGKPNTEPEYDPEHRQYAYIHRSYKKFMRY